MNAELYLASLLDDAVAKVPQAQGLRDFLRATCGLGLRDVLDHVVLPGGDHAAQEWIQVAPGIWRNEKGAPPLRKGHGPRVVLRVEDLSALLRALGLDRAIEGAAHGPYRRACLFEGGGVGFDAAERSGWTGFDLPEVSERQCRRARIHYQALASRRRAFRDAEQGYALLKRSLEAAVADLGEHWASGVFLQAEREHWQAHCVAAQVQGRRQTLAGFGWSNMAHVVFTASHEHFHLAAEIGRLLGYRQTGWRGEGESIAAVFECPMLSRPALLIEVDGPEPPSAEHVAPTWLGGAGLWCGLHGEGMLEGGARALAVMSETPAAAIDEGRRAVNPARVDALERERYLSRATAEELRLNGAEGAQLQWLAHGARASAPPFVHLAAAQTETAEPEHRRQRHRIKRQR